MCIYPLEIRCIRQGYYLLLLCIGVGQDDVFSCYCILGVKYSYGMSSFSPFLSPGL